MPGSLWQGRLEYQSSWSCLIVFNAFCLYFFFVNNIFVRQFEVIFILKGPKDRSQKNLFLKNCILDNHEVSFSWSWLKGSIPHKSQNCAVSGNPWWKNETLKFWAFCAMDPSNYISYAISPKYENQISEDRTIPLQRNGTNSWSIDRWELWREANWARSTRANNCAKVFCALTLKRFG